MNINVENLGFSYGEHQVLHDVGFTAHGGELLSILGPNGVGKSTLLRCMLGLLKSYKGSITIDGRDIKTLSVRENSRLIAYIPQTTTAAFNYSVADIVLMGTTSGLSTLSSPGKADIERAGWAMEKIGITKLRNRCFHHISGGERQLCLIARALVQSAPVLMFDEPTAALDFGNQIMVLTQAKELAAEGYTVIQTTHNPEQSYLFSDRIIALKGGTVLANGSPGELMTKELMSELYSVDIRVSSLYGDRARVCIPEAFAADDNTKYMEESK